jgi:iron uptake system EfeUOB component EfeO/EfeM
MTFRRALRNAVAGVALVLAGAALPLVVAACGSSSSEPVAHPISTVGAHPDVTVSKVAGGVHSLQVEAAIASEQTRNPGPAEELEPLSPTRFDQPVAEYRAYSSRQARQVQVAVGRLRAALGAGDAGAAKGAWFDAYDHYLRLGAAYGALGRLDEEIDGNPGRLPGNAHSPEFTGLHRIEMGLWEGEEPARLIGPADYLAAKVKRLQTVVKTIKIPPLVYATRAHEILEDAQRDMLSDVDAPWSGAGLRATADSLAATEFVIGTLRPALDEHGEAVEPVEVEMARFGAALRRVRREHGGDWPPLEAMTPMQHERVNGALGSLLERLSAIPAELEIVRTKPVPTIAAQKQERQ